MIISPEILPRMSAGQYLDYEQTQEIRHELVDGYLYAMVGASDRHEEIAMNLAAALSLHLRGGPCRVYKSDLKLRIGDDFYYPDIFVRCGTERGDPYFKTDPVLIVEVLSPDDPALRSRRQTSGVPESTFTTRLHTDFPN